MAVAAAGSCVAVGVPNDDTGATNAGLVYVYDLEGSNPGVPVAVLANPSPAVDDFFGSVVAMEGTLLITAAYNDDTGATNAGAVYVYDLAGVSPEVPVRVLANPSPATSDFFGRALDISGNLVAVGVLNDDTGASNAGLVYVFDLAAADPAVPTVTVPHPAPAGNDSFGSAVAISGNRLAAGVPAHDTGASNAGRVYLFDLLGSTASVRTVLDNPAPESSDQFGSVLAMDGPLVVVGVPQDDSGASNAGSIYVFDANRAMPALPAAVIPHPEAGSSHQFGFSAALSGVRVLVGAPIPGSAFVYEVSGAVPVRGPDLRHASLAGDNRYGTAVAVSGSRVAIGAPNDDTAGTDAGQVYVYDRNSATPGVPLLRLTRPGALNTDRFGSALALEGDILVVGAYIQEFGTSSVGRAFVYDLAAANPSEPVRVLYNPEPGAQDNFARSLAISGSRVLVGAPYRGPGDTGTIYVFDLNSTQPGRPVETIHNPAPATNDYFGWVVAMGGRYAAAGEGSAGSVYVFDLDGAIPSRPLVVLQNPVSGPANSFGASLAVAGSLLVVGASGDDTGATNAGRVHVYDLAAAVPGVPFMTLPPPIPVANDAFGSAVAVSGSRVAVAAQRNDTGATDAGRVFIYDLATPAPTAPLWTLDNPAPGTSDEMGTALALDGTRLVAGMPRDDAEAPDWGAAALFDLPRGRPSVSTGTVSGVTSVQAVLSGTVHPHGLGTTAVFEYGLTTAYGSSTAVSLTPPDGNAAQPVSATLNGLTPGAVYHYRLMAQNAAGSSLGLDRIFTPASVYPAHWASAAGVPVSASGFTATGRRLSALTFGFFPAPGTALTLVNNTAGTPVAGTFVDLPEGGTATAVHSGETLHFLTTYQGGDGNDIVLTRIAALGQVPDAYAWSVFSGLPGGSGNIDGTGGAARFGAPQGVAVDSAGNAYVADYFGYTIRKITSAGVVTTLAGSPGQQGTTNGTGSAARFHHPQDIAVDSAGNLYVVDVNHAIRKVTPAGVVTTLAGLGGTSGSADGTGSAARFYAIRGIGIDTAGNLYVADTGNCTIRKVTPAGVVTTVAGLAGSSGSTEGTGSAARFYNPEDVTADASGNLYVADAGNDKIRKITAGGVVTTLAGGRGSADGTGTAGKFYSPSRIAADSSGNLYVADTYNYTIRKVTAAGVVTTLAGTAGLRGSVDATGSAARFSGVYGVAVSGSTVYVSDTNNHAVRRITTAGVVTTLAGVTGSYGTADGAVAAGRFSSPSDLARTPSGDFLTVDYDSHTLRRISPGGAVTTVAGLAGTPGNANGTGSVARFNIPLGVAVDVNGDYIVADTGNHTIRRVTPSGVVTLLAGVSGSGGHVDGPAATAKFSNPEGVAVDSAGIIYVTSGNRIRRIALDGTVSTFAGQESAGSTNATGTGASFNSPNDIAVEANGNLLVADTNNRAIRRITPAGVVTTLSISNPPANIIDPDGVASGTEGTVFIADGRTVQRILADGTLTIMGGDEAFSGSLPGTGAAARFSVADGIHMTSAGLLYVTDRGANCVMKGVPAGFPPIVTTSPPFSGASSATLRGTVDANGFSSTAWFEYGPTEALGFTASVPVAPANRLSPAGVSYQITGLTPGSTWHYRLSASNRDGTVNSATASFTVAGPLDAHFSAPGTVLFTLGGFTATGSSLNSLSLGFTPSAGTVLTLVNNTGPGAITGTFINHPEGSGITSQYAGNTFTFRVSYMGGDGNDLTLTRVNSGSQIPALQWSTLAGQPGAAGSADGTGMAARFQSPGGIAVDAAGNLYVADTGNHTLRRISPAGVVTTLAGVAGSSGGSDGAGPAARFLSPGQLSLDSAGVLFMVDTGNHSIRRVTDAGAVTTLAGSAGLSGSANGTGSAARFSSPEGIAANVDGTIAVADTGNHTIRLITAAGAVSTLAGTAGMPGNANGSGAAARFQSPRGLHWNSFSDLVICDTGNAAIRRASSGIVSTYLGQPGQPGTSDGYGSAARFSAPSGLAAYGNFYHYCADAGNPLLRRSAPYPIVTSLTGNPVAFQQPRAVAIAPDGTVYVADTGNHRIAKGVPAGSPPVILADTATDITRSRATIRTTVIPNSLNTLVRIEFGPTASYGNTQYLNAAPISGAGVFNFTIPLAGLTAGTLYHYRIVAENADGPGATANQTFLTLTGQSQFSGFTAVAGLSGGNAAATATPFHDGVENLLKYAFNMNLAGADSGAMSAGGSAGLPVISGSENGPGEVLRFEFLRRTGSGLQYVPQKSNSLSALGWLPLADSPTITPINAEWERVVYEEPLGGAGDRCFGRVQVALP